MKPTMNQYQAIINCQENDDYYYAVKTTKIFCRFSCKSKAPNLNNILIFAKNSKNLANFRPCKRCEPLNPQPTNIIDKFKNYLKNCQTKITLEQCAKALGYNTSYLSRNLAQHGIKFKEYLKNEINN
ncbi:Ada metal-binding domain-containing protein [Spiroplasma eriocheiris]|uniref:Methylphosphotriester-DNA alkyltransferase n=1 Tax=Spiroplasma eriocheiris TaxID=315358 RepID=A0A0H3XIP9_9MOLU|nr:Ada metal-binding domain-containing protein [Spiroplasma eriocheiris]AHF58338.1 truncated methylphosphotriester-DNA alkyltransferase [Spiroplasma eriocheiris CCTCC M 207170]AKM54773.1 methylphosphotriester-DNA alkyltransferase [Spiroplasma eriocheiris]